MIEHKQKSVRKPVNPNVNVKYTKAKARKTMLRFFLHTRRKAPYWSLSSSSCVLNEKTAPRTDGVPTKL